MSFMKNKSRERNQTINKIWYNYTVFIRGVYNHKENLATNRIPRCLTGDAILTIENPTLYMVDSA